MFLHNRTFHKTALLFFLRTDISHSRVRRANATRCAQVFNGNKLGLYALSELQQLQSEDMYLMLIGDDSLIVHLYV